jgi:hypothetical protein
MGRFTEGRDSSKVKVEKHHHGSLAYPTLKEWDCAALFFSGVVILKMDSNNQKTHLRKNFVDFMIDSYIYSPLFKKRGWRNWQTH